MAPLPTQPISCVRTVMCLVPSAPPRLSARPVQPTTPCRPTLVSTRVPRVLSLSMLFALHVVQDVSNVPRLQHALCVRPPCTSAKVNVSPHAPMVNSCQSMDHVATVTHHVPLVTPSRIVPHVMPTSYSLVPICQTELVLPDASQDSTLIVESVWPANPNASHAAVPPNVIHVSVVPSTAPTSKIVLLIAVLATTKTLPVRVVWNVHWIVLNVVDHLNVMHALVPTTSP